MESPRPRWMTAPYPLVTQDSVNAGGGQGTVYGWSFATGVKGSGVNVKWHVTW